MEVTKVSIYPREKEGSRLKAFVDFTLDDCLAIKGAKIIEGNTRLFVSMPGKINKFGKEENIVFPNYRIRSIIDINNDNIYEIIIANMMYDEPIYEIYELNNNKYEMVFSTTIGR